MFTSTAPGNPTDEELDRVREMFAATDDDPKGAVVIPTKPFHRTAKYLKSLGTIQTPEGEGTYESVSRDVFACTRRGEDKPFDLVPSNDLMIQVRLGEDRYESWQLEVLLAFNPPETVVFNEDVNEAPSFIPGVLDLEQPLEPAPPLAYTVNDRRGTGSRTVEVCRFCGSPNVHTREYDKPTAECAKYLRQKLHDVENCDADFQRALGTPQ